MRPCSRSSSGSRRSSAGWRRLGRPVVAALNGTALGGGFELALACHHRIAVDRPDARFGLPEVTLGLLPGGGGVVRVTRMLGITDALMKVLLQGQRMRPAQAHEAGLVDELVVHPGRADAGRGGLDRRPTRAPAPSRGTGPATGCPAARPTDPALAAMLPAFPANLRKQLKGANYPAPRAIMSAAVEGAQVDFDTALRIESRWFASLVGTPGPAQHDPGVLLRPRPPQPRRLPAGGRRRSPGGARSAWSAPA